jgi:hypothetical protein
MLFVTMNVYEIMIRKDVTVAYNTDTRLERLRKITRTSVMMTVNPIEVRTGYLLNTFLEF